MFRNTEERDFLIREDTTKKLTKDLEGKSIKLEWGDYFLLFDIILITYFSQMMITVPMTFFSRVVVDRNETLTTASIILQSSPAAAACVGVPIGKYLHVLQVKRTIVFGVLLEACSAVAFGFLNNLVSNIAFTIVGILLRMLSGIGNCAVNTALLSLSIDKFSTHSNLILGFMESSIGLAYLTGIIFGALLYNVYHDMMLPFAVLSGCYILSILRFVLYFKPHGEIVTNKEMQTWHLLKNMRILVVLFALGSMHGVPDYVDITLTLFMRKLNWTVLDVAWIDLVLCALCMITTAACGFLLNKYPTLASTTLLLGLIGTGTSLITTAFALNTWKSYAIFSAFEFSIAIVIVGSYSDNLKTAEETFPHFDKSVIHSSLAGLWTTFAYVAQCTYPVIGSIIEKEVGSIEMSYTYFGVYVYVLTALSVIIFGILKHKA